MLFRDTKQVDALWSDMTGALSGGTVISLFGALLDDHGQDSVVQTDPYGLDPPDSMRGPDKGESLKPGYSKLQDKPFVPFVMAPVNTRIVRRSNALLGHKYGKLSTYEISALTRGPEISIPNPILDTTLESSWQALVPL